ncbi:FecR family protein [Collimonas sp. OK242]|nr:FecR family protein [Collimonas sp. OK242]SDX24965.1 FecR family protein [Collimonas sp. OK242]
MKAKLFALTCLLFIAGVLFGPSALADPPGRVGRLSYISGPVSFAPAGLDTEWSLAAINRPVTIGDRLWSDQGGRAEVHIGSTAIRLGTNTNVDVLNLDGRTTQLRIVQGTLNVRVRHAARDDLFEIDTPNAAVLVQRPGNYRIDVDPNGRQTAVSVRFGEVEVSGPDANFLLYDDQQATLFSDSPDYNLTRLPPLDSFDRFWLARDQRQDRVRSLDYVPDDMTGYEDLDTYGSWATVSTYGAVWFPARVAVDWAPYRDGRWMWVEPWGWTWVDSAPWGFAPFHYGRWAYIQGRWGWCPGDIQARPVYAPALVAFVGGSGFSASISIASGPVVGWFPLGYREAYVPWYSVSPTYVRQVNVANVTNVTNITNITNVTNVTNVNYANRNVPSAMTVVSGAVFTQSGLVAPSMLKTAAVQELARAPVIHGGAPIAPARQSLSAGPAAVRPPATVISRPVVAINAPAPRPASFAVRQAEIAKQPDKPFQVRPLEPAAAPVGIAPSSAGAQAPVRMIQPPHGGNPQPAVQSNAGRPPEGRAMPQAGQSPDQPPAGAPSRPPEAVAPKGPAGTPSNVLPPPLHPDEQVRPGAPGAVPHPPEPRGLQTEERARPVVTPGRPPAMKTPEVPRVPQAEERVKPGATLVPPQPGRPIEAPRPPQAEERVRPGPPIAPQPQQNILPPVPRPREEMGLPQPQHPVPPPRIEERARPAPPPPQQPHPEVRQGPPPQGVPAPSPHEQGKPPELHRPPEKDKEKQEGNQ